MPLSKLLVANRGEIACRVIRTAKCLGYRTVAVYSAADARSPHVTLADEAIAIGPAPAAQSYLSIERIIEAAQRSGADAIHPGYGFLSENALFVRACGDASITFVGPSAEAVELMGNKRAAKLRMQGAGVPTVPGYSGTDQSDETLAAEAARIGFPVVVKAAAGGGGRGMRLVDDPAEMKDALRSARAEAESAFGNGELILEKAILRSRHVEVQVFGDSHGNVVHLGERDCSVQRRHQKVIEESPSPAVNEALRQAMGLAAVEAARAVEYVGAGTVEFLLDSEGAYYFLEMNTRLQVEHPVTEMVTGLDLVEWQLRVASGEPLPLRQDEIALSGHAIEARLYAEDPTADFRPQTGRVLRFRGAPGSDARVDAGVADGSVVGPHYDPMLAKVIVHAATRTDACRKLAASLKDVTLFGVVNNKAFLAGICEHPAFVAGEATTAFLGSESARDLPMTRTPPDLVEAGAAALVIMLTTGRSLVDDESLIGWHSGGPVWTVLVLKCDETEASVRIVRERSTEAIVFSASREGEETAEKVRIEVAEHTPDALHLVIEGRRRVVRYAIEGDRIWVDDGRRPRLFEDVTHRRALVHGSAGSGRIVAPLDGAVRGIFVEAGAAVSRGQTLLVLEAMKMEHPIKADTDGILKSLSVTEGTQVKARQLLAEISPSGEA